MFERIRNRLQAWYEKKLKDWEPQIERAKKITFPGLDKVPAYDVAIFFWNEVTRDRIVTRAKSIAYSFFIALFPGVIFLFTLIPFIPIEGFQPQLMEMMENLLPTDKTFNALLSSISDIIYEPQGSLLSISLLITFYFSTNGVLAIMDSFDKQYSLFFQRNFIVKNWIAFKLTLILFFLFISSVVLIIAGEWILNAIRDWLDIRSALMSFSLEFLRILVTIALFLLSIGTIYRYAPATERNWKFLSPGTTLATILSLLSSLGFSFFVSNFGRYNQIYGSIAAVVIVLIWLYLNALVLLIGFELNASIYYNKSLADQQDE